MTYPICASTRAKILRDAVCVPIFINYNEIERKEH